MLSRHLWRTIASTDIHDPIFRRVSQNQANTPVTRRRFRASRRILLVALLALVGILITSPQLSILIFLIPILMITLIVASPILLPVVALLAGFQLTADVISGISREKRQFTYDLICASTQGMLNASWSFAIGILHRGRWFAPLRWGTVATFRLGTALALGFGILALLVTLAGSSPVGYEQLRLLLLVALLLALYFINLAQTIVLSLISGLLASSFDWSKPDATLFGLIAYAVLNGAPLVVAGLVLVAFALLAPDPHPLLEICVESVALLLIIALREAAIVLLWWGLRRRLDWGRDRERHHLEPSLFRAA